MAEYIVGNRDYQNAPIVKVPATVAGAVTTAPAAVGDAALRTEVDTALSNIETTLTALVTAVNEVITALNSAGIAAP